MRYLISLMLLILISMTGCRYAEVPRADKDHPAIATGENRALHLEPVELVINNKELPKRPPEFKK